MKIKESVDYMKTKVTVVVDNIASNGISGEWGLSILVEYGDKKILLDAGGSSLFLKNMKSLGIDVKDIDYATLSHAHSDHANGLPAFLDNNQKAKLYLRESTDTDCYMKVLFVKSYVGIPKNLLNDYSDRIEMVSGDYKLTEGVYLVPHKTVNLEKQGKRDKMYRRTSSGWKIDNFSHEQSLVLDTDKGLVIINSCSHGGAANIINEVKKTFPDKKVYGLIGGFHLYNKSKTEIKDLADSIRSTGIEYVCTGHCTKNRAYKILKEELGDIVNQMRVGYEISF